MKKMAEGNVTKGATRECGERLSVSQKSSRQPAASVTATEYVGKENIVNLDADVAAKISPIMKRRTKKRTKDTTTSLSR
jgi:hypothetical protein